MGKTGRDWVREEWSWTRSVETLRSVLALD
jgi:hypothetical protein